MAAAQSQLFLTAEESAPLALLEPPPNLRTEVVLVDAVMAKTWLERTRCNIRPMSPSNVENLAAQMEAGVFRLTHQGVALDTCPGGGCVLDGRHRLMAIIKLDKPAYMMVTYNMPPEYFKAIDTGKQRNFADLAAIETGKAKYSAQRAAVARSVHALDQGTSWESWSKVRMHGDLLVEALRMYHIDDQRLADLAVVAKESYMTHASVVLGWYLCYREWPQGPYDKFFEGLETQSNMPRSDPRRVLFRRMKNSGQAGNKRPGYVIQAAMLIKAWNAWNEGEQPQVFSQAKGTRWPDPYTPSK